MEPTRPAGCLLLLLAVGVSAQEPPDDQRRTGVEQTLSRIDKKVEKLDAQTKAKTQGRGGVVGLLSRHYAGALGNGRRAYTLATYNFAHRTRDDRQQVRNRWHILYGNGARNNSFGIRMVAGDMSEIWDLGPVDFETMKLHVPPRSQRQEYVTVVRDHVLVLRFHAPRETTLWVKLKILEVEPARFVIFRWEKLTDARAILRAERENGVLLQDGLVKLQIRGGANGGNPRRVTMSGDTSIRKPAKGPLELGPAIHINEQGQAYSRGGLIPLGFVWDVRRVVWEARAKGDSNGGGEFGLSLDGRRLVYIENQEEEEVGAWNGRVVLRPGDEPGVYAEIANSSQCSVRIYGVLRPEAEADVEKLPPLTAEEKRDLTRWIDVLGSNVDAEWERAMVGIQELGVRAVKTLRAVSMDGRSKRFKERFAALLEELAGN